MIASRALSARGIGCVLLEHAAETARRASIDLLRLGCYAASDGRLFAYYESVGLSQVDRFAIELMGSTYSGPLLEQRLTTIGQVPVHNFDNSRHPRPSKARRRPVRPCRRRTPPLSLERLLEEFAARYSGKVSPVHHFWHTFDIAHTRFSERHVVQPREADPVTREAYSREVISFGFWFGDDAFAEPPFYSYTAPEPAGLADQPLQPGTARWTPRNGSHLAVLRYDDARAEADPRAAVLAFYETAYQAGARLAGWDTAGLTCPGGVTDPHLPPPAPTGS